MLRTCGALLLGRSDVVVLAAARAGFATTPAAAAAAAAAAGAMQKVGFIGLGRMGARMVPRLLDAGYEVVVEDKNQLALERIVEIGRKHPKGTVTVRDSPAALSATPGIGAVFTVLPDNACLKDVFLGRRGLLAAPGGIHPSLFINVSTIEPDAARELAQRVGRAQLAPGAAPLTKGARPVLLDAPATGGVVGAERGELCFSVGCDEAADLQAARLLLDIVGSHVTHTGPVGTGSVAKLCNALVLGATMAAVSEALALGRRMHLDPAILTDVLNSGSGQSWVSQKYNPVPGVVPGAPAGSGYKAGQQVDQIRDQLLMLIKAGESAHSPTPVARFTEELYEAMHNEGLGGKDFSSIFRYRYGSGCDNPEWKEGEQLFSSQIP